jgi:branched-chain amino acid transport system substrate-binding protein
VKSKRLRAYLALPAALIIGLTVCTATTASAASSTKAPIVIGGVYQAADYPGLADGFNARIASFNKAGGVKGHKIKFLGVQDDGSSPATDQQVIQKLVEEQHVAVVAPILSNEFTPSSSTFLSENKVPFSGWAETPDWCNNPYGFSADGCLIPSNGEVSLADGGGLADYLKTLGKTPADTSLAIVNLDIPTAAASASYELLLFKAAGFNNIVFNKGVIPVNGTATNYTPYVEQIMATNPGAVFLSLDFASSAGLSAGLSAAGYKGVVYSPGVTYSEGLLQAQPSVRAALQGQIDGTEFPAAEDNSAATKAIAAALKSIGKTQPLGLAAVIGYYTADMIIQMLENAAKKGKPLTGAGIAAAANSGFNYKVTYKGGACAQTYPAAHAAGTVGITMLQVEGAQYKLKVPYSCFKNVKAPAS